MVYSVTLHTSSSATHLTTLECTVPAVSVHAYTFYTLYVPVEDYLLSWSTDGRHIILKCHQLEAQIKTDIYFCCVAVFVFPGAGSISPVNDLCGVEWFNCSKAERQGRCKLACLYRLLDLYGHTHFPNTYITVSTHTAHKLFFKSDLGLTILTVILHALKLDAFVQATLVVIVMA